MLRVLALCLLSVTLLLSAEDLRTRVIAVLGSAAGFDSGNYVEVEHQLSDAAAKGGNDAGQLLAIRGAVQFVAHDLRGAIESYAAAAKLGALSDGDKFTYAMALANQGASAKAHILIAELRTAYPKTALYTYWLGRLDYYDRRYELAIEELHAAVELDSNSVRAWNGLGLAYDMRGRTDDASLALGKAVELNRTQARHSPWPPNDLGSLELRLQRPAEAEHLFREALRYDPRLWEAHYHLGRALDQQGKGSEAIEEYRVAIAGDEESADACYALAQLLRKQRRESEAAAMFEEFKRRKHREDAVTAPPLMH